MHIKAISEKPSEYPDRFLLSSEQVRWEDACPGYAPVEYTSPIVSNQFQKFKDKGWADPENMADVTRQIVSFVKEIEFDSLARPVNPVGRTGISGRGLLGKWGPNFAQDALLSRFNPTTEKVEILVILRKDRLQWALPGGMVDEGETGVAAAQRELLEETSVSLDLSPSDVIYEGYVDDPRNTDNAWMETTVIHKNVAFSQSQKFKLNAGDDAKKVEWKEANPDFLDELYASHKKFVEIALKI